MSAEEQLQAWADQSRMVRLTWHPAIGWMCELWPPMAARRWVESHQATMHSTIYRGLGSRIEDAIDAAEEDRARREITAGATQGDKNR